MWRSYHASEASNGWYNILGFSHLCKNKLYGVSDLVSNVDVWSNVLKKIF